MRSRREAEQTPVDRLPDDVLMYLTRQPLLRDRPVGRHRLGHVRRHRRRLGPKAQAIVDFAHRPYHFQLR